TPSRPIRSPGRALRVKTEPTRIPSGDTYLEAASIEMNHREIPRHDRRHRIDRPRGDERMERFVEPSERRETRHGIPMVRRCAPRIEREGALEFAFCPPEDGRAPTRNRSHV